MYSYLPIIGLAFLINFICIMVLVYMVYREKKIKDQLFPGDLVKDKKEAYEVLMKRLDNVTSAVEEILRKDEILSKHLKEVAKDGLHHIQKVHLSRYNPYEDTGGDQSFSIAMLTGNLDGLLITSMHSRAGTRIYAKNIKAGKSDVELSKEEQEVLDKAVRN